MRETLSFHHNGRYIFFTPRFKARLGGIVSTTVEICDTVLSQFLQTEWYIIVKSEVEGTFWWNRIYYPGNLMQYATDQVAMKPAESLGT